MSIVRILAALVFVVGSLAQEGKVDEKGDEQPQESGVVERYAAGRIRIDFESKTLTWTVVKGDFDPEAGEFVPGTHSEKVYEIRFFERTMKVGEEERLFSLAEQLELAAILNLFENFFEEYVAASTTWWMRGEGEKVLPEQKGPKKERKIGALKAKLDQ